MSDNIDPGVVQAAQMVSFLFLLCLRCSNPSHNHL